MNYACRAALSPSGVAHVAIPIEIQAMSASKENPASSALNSG
ncbi:hypothetical protein ABQJ48_27835 [Paraburkholderia sp. DGU8]